MFFPQLKFSATLVPVNGINSNCLALVYQGNPSLTLFSTALSLPNHFTSAALVRSCVGRHCPRAFLAAVGPENRRVESYSRECCAGQSNESSRTNETSTDSYSSSASDSSSINETEILRRRRIGLANKGKVPWNKGRGHSEEARERIRQRTREALNDPKVRKKMAERPRSHSNRTKAKIQLSLRKLWRQRLKRKRAKEEIFQLWAESIANAAKSGGNGQGKLEWDSYDKQRKEMALQEEIQALQERSERNDRLAKKRKEREEKAKAAKHSSKEKKKSKEENEELAVTEELKLKARLTKIHSKKSLISQVSSEHLRAWKNLDVRFMNVERSLQQVTLADQIHLAKVKRLEFASQGISSSI